MKDIYNLCFYGGMTLAIILLITSIVLFIVFKIPKVIGDLTGRNARREIAERKKKKNSKLLSLEKMTIFPSKVATSSSSWQKLPTTS